MLSLIAAAMLVSGKVREPSTPFGAINVTISISSTTNAVVRGAMATVSRSALKLIDVSLPTLFRLAISRHGTPRQMLPRRFDESIIYDRKFNH